MNFKEILDELDIPVAPEGHHHQTDGWIQFDCPFCGMNSHKYHMGYNIQGGFTNCWRCGGHSVASVIHEYTHMPFAKIKQLLKQVDTLIKRVKKENWNRLAKLPPNVGELRYAHVRYLTSRGYDIKELQHLWQIKGIGPLGTLHWRIFIPIIHKGQVVSWTTRSLSNTGTRYISAKPEQEVIPHKNILYGMDYVRSTAILVEGPLDVWSVGPGTVCTFGTAVSSSQILAMSSVRNRVICFDSNDEAQKQAKKLTEQLGPFPGKTTNVILDADDPGSANRREIKQLRKFLKN